MLKRHTVRAILLNSSNQLYLMKIKPNNVSEKDAKPGREFWVTIGGEVEDKESDEDALRRELYEEAGIRSAMIHQPAAWYGEIVLNCNGKEVLFCEHFFIVNVASDVISQDGLLEHEREVFSDHKWWRMDELKQSNEVFVPRNVFELLTKIVNNDTSIRKTEIIDLSIK
ncbi:NUDIX domain-containing protein [Candidatus Saccharibacteria bacterium]|nr:NUDIX domain-containing protein [Candidatus Saccharibacteria bacterium]